MPPGLAAVTAGLDPGRGEAVRVGSRAGGGSEGSPRYDVVVEPACALSGSVSTADGMPLAGARVAADPSYFLVDALRGAGGRRDAEDQARWWAYAAEAAEDGRFAFGGLPRGPVTLLAEAEGFRPAFVEIDCVPDGAIQGVDLVLDPDTCWTLRVRDEGSGRGIAGAEVVALSILRSRAGWTGEEVRTDAEGLARICAVPPIGSSVEVSADGYATNVLRNYEGHDAVELLLRPSGDVAGWTSPPVEDGSCASCPS